MIWQPKNQSLLALQCFMVESFIFLERKSVLSRTNFWWGFKPINLEKCPQLFRDYSFEMYSACFKMFRNGIPFLSGSHRNSSALLQDVRGKLLFLWLLVQGTATWGRVCRGDRWSKKGNGCKAIPSASWTHGGLYPNRQTNEINSMIRKQKNYYRNSSVQLHK